MIADIVARFFAASGDVGISHAKAMQLATFVYDDVAAKKEDLAIRLSRAEAELMQAKRDLSVEMKRVLPRIRRG